ncbi:hypothetical protein AcW1_009429 [Taiwanofungus camphoratus]|nr:hypothetical protein AcV5_003500 [Antrodia cinnamomea]KAI0934968.1 hypothetical protein AcV7_003892 [Antrodia cinnamomea]KAI0947747.1 hypothetical protein AcW1_009429 [Antrodia cinnamomea]
MGSNYTSEGSLQAHDYSAFYALNVYKYGRIEWSPCSDAQLTWSAYRWSFYDTTTYTVPFVKVNVTHSFCHVSRTASFLIERVLLATNC